MKPATAALTLPPSLRALLGHLPEEPPAWLIATALNLALTMKVFPRDTFDSLRGKRLRLELADVGVGVTLSYGERGFAMAGGVADVTIRAGSVDYVRLALRCEDPDTLFFSRRLLIEGDTDLGLIMKNALDAVDWDRLPAPLRKLLRHAQKTGAH